MPKMEEQPVTNVTHDALARLAAAAQPLAVPGSRDVHRVLTADQVARALETPDLAGVCARHCIGQYRRKALEAMAGADAAPDDLEAAAGKLFRGTVPIPDAPGVGLNLAHLGDLVDPPEVIRAVIDNPTL